MCEQLQESSEAKGLVDRGVTEVLTPGSLLSENLLESGESVYLAALAPPLPGEKEDEPRFGFAVADASTGELRCGAASEEGVLAELSRVRVAEWLVPEGTEWSPGVAALIEGTGTMTALPVADFPEDLSGLERRFGGTRLPDDVRAAREVQRAVGAVVQYLDRVQGGRAAQLRAPEWVAPGACLLLGREAQASLELFTSGTGVDTHTLWAVLRRTVTGAGARRLRRWLERPLVDLGAIERRLDGVAYLAAENAVREKLREQLAATYDLERLTARLRAERASPRDLVALRETLERLPDVRETAAGGPNLLTEVAGRLDPHADLLDLLQRALVDEPPNVTHEGGLIRPGYDAECDRLRAAARSGKEWMANFEAAERERTGIPSLKLGYNRVFGYYLEVTKTHTSRVPEDYERRQTLTNAERYVAPELKRMEGEVLGAEEKQKHAEQACFLSVRSRAAACADTLAPAAEGLAVLDALAALAEVAVREGFARPQVHGGDAIRVRGARHPVVERNLGAGRYVPNDFDVDGTERQILLVTGPNMGGKSTYLRTLGLLVVLAQAGSFVPA
ncbi:MAG: DNA mismatch repair protein MutS, partial [Thermoanaerobaculia bacterium]|nr:DNA mismatch repair protein MutS [Thermoanaerobaculia bacterium]